eukprot:TRINITY_DN55684_c0_g1_i1.p1 TRINITY_DN55684_c0_g1~~TRINITY_DN55684_c0_g1_i1.p1  ORF type:complete len:610 (+),score=274.18 TRINITY_DN55684_c0_g1_i1:93-1922(+)
MASPGQASGQQARDADPGARVASVIGRPGPQRGPPVGAYWRDRDGVQQHGDPEVELPEGPRAVDACRRMVYDDLLVSAARRSHGGMDLGAVNDARRQYFENHKALRMEHQRERDQQWEHEKFVHAERQVETVRERDRTAERDAEWDRVQKAEQDRQQEMERRFEEEIEILRDDWAQEKRFEREKEQQRAREWDQVREGERRRMRQKLDDFREECARERRQWAERQLQWEAEKQRYLADWKEDDEAERAAWERWFQQLKEEHQLRKKKWDNERADLRKEYLALEGGGGTPTARSAAGGPSRRQSQAGGPSRRQSLAAGQQAEEIERAEGASEGAVKDMVTWVGRCAKKADGPPALPEEITRAFWLFVHHDADGDGSITAAELGELAGLLAVDQVDALVAECGAQPSVSAERWVEWIARKDPNGERTGAALDLAGRLQQPEAAEVCAPMGEAQLSERYAASSDAKLQLGVKVMRKVWALFGAVREKELEQASLAQERATMDAAISDGDGAAYITELEATPDYAHTGFAPGELRGVFEDYFAEATRGRAALSFSDGSFDRMLARLRIDDFAPQERSVTEMVWGDMDFDRFLCWLSTRKQDRKPLAIADILLS